MDFLLSSQLSSWQWVSPRRLLLCRCVTERDIPNASVTGRDLEHHRARVATMGVEWAAGRV